MFILTYLQSSIIKLFKNLFIFFGHQRGALFLIFQIIILLFCQFEFLVLCRYFQIWMIPRYYYFLNLSVFYFFSSRYSSTPLYHPNSIFSIVNLLSSNPKIIIILYNISILYHFITLCSLPAQHPITPNYIYMYQFKNIIIK